MSDIENLQNLSAQLKHGAQQFSSASQTLSLQARGLDWSAQDLANGANAWAGAGSQNFTTAWNTYHQSTQKSVTALNNTSQALTRLAQKIDETVQQLQDQQAQQSSLAIGMGVLTVGLVVLDVLQLGLDPVTDGLTVAAGSADAAAISGTEAAAGSAEVAAQGLVEADAQIAGDLDEIVNGIDNVADSGDIAADGGTTPGDINVDDGPFNDNGSTGDGSSSDGSGNGDGTGNGNGSGNGGRNPYGGSNSGGEDPNDLINQLKESGKKFNEEDIVGITRTPDGKIVWVEEGSPSAGLDHIMNGDGTPGDIGHGADFANIGVNGPQSVTKLIIDTLQNETPIGSTSSGGQIYNVLINGVLRRILIVVGKNGFVVTAFPL